jgi:hypothetical protein
MDSPRRVYLPLPDDYFDLTDDEQEAVCEQIAKALIDQLGVPDKLLRDHAERDERPRGGS